MPAVDTTVLLTMAKDGVPAVARVGTAHHRSSVTTMHSTHVSRRAYRTWWLWREDMHTISY